MEPLDRFREIVREYDFPLADAFLGFARAEYPDLDTDRYLSELTDLGAQAAQRLAPIATDAYRLRALSDMLSSEGFGGNEDDYSDPRNSFLNDVMDRKLGVPISLAVIWIEVARRADLPLVGIGMPMHFLVGLEGTELYIDAFDRGRVLDIDEVEALFNRLSSGRMKWNRDFLEPVGARDIVRRALNNLKATYAADRDLKRSLWVQDFLLALPDTSVSALRERASVLSGLGRWPEAIADLHDYLISEPEDADEVEAEIRKMYATMN